MIEEYTLDLSLADFKDSHILLSDFLLSTPDTIVTIPNSNVYQLATLKVFDYTRVDYPVITIKKEVDDSKLTALASLDALDKLRRKGITYNLRGPKKLTSKAEPALEVLEIPPPEYKMEPALAVLFSPETEGPVDTEGKTQFIRWYSQYQPGKPSDMDKFLNGVDKTIDVMNSVTKTMDTVFGSNSTLSAVGNLTSSTTVQAKNIFTNAVASFNNVKNGTLRSYSASPLRSLRFKLEINNKKAELSWYIGPNVREDISILDMKGDKSQFTDGPFYSQFNPNTKEGKKADLFDSAIADGLNLVEFTISESGDKESGTKITRSVKNPKAYSIQDIADNGNWKRPTLYEFGEVIRALDFQTQEFVAFFSLGDDYKARLDIPLSKPEESDLKYYYYFYTNSFEFTPVKKTKTELKYGHYKTSIPLLAGDGNSNFSFKVTADIGLTMWKYLLQSGLGFTNEAFSNDIK